MSLLVEVLSDTLDGSYRAAAERRAGGAAQPDGPTPTRTARLRRGAAVPLLVVLGLLTGTAAAQVRARAAGDEGLRGGLVAEVSRRTAQSDALAGQVAALRRDVAALQDAALGTNAAGRQAAEQLAALELAAGTVPVRGPGLVVELDDAPAPDHEEVAARGGTPGQGRVLDRDLQDAVNGLWAAGAEAVSVNDLRLSALTAIRSAGEAVLVDFRPVSPPYVVRAVGDPERLERDFRAGAAWRRLESFPALYGIAVDLRADDGLRLPAAGVPALRSVQVPAAATS